MGQEPPREIGNLIERFQRNLEAYRSQSYNETQLRQEFINPLFQALGWDIAIWLVTPRRTRMSSMRMP